MVVGLPRRGTRSARRTRSRPGTTRSSNVFTISSPARAQPGKRGERGRDLGVGERGHRLPFNPTRPDAATLGACPASPTSPKPRRPRKWSSTATSGLTLHLARRDARLASASRSCGVNCPCAGCRGLREQGLDAWPTPGAPAAVAGASRPSSSARWGMPDHTGTTATRPASTRGACSAPGRPDVGLTPRSGCRVALAPAEAVVHERAHDLRRAAGRAK